MNIFKHCLSGVSALAKESSHTPAKHDDCSILLCPEVCDGHWLLLQKDLRPPRTRTQQGADWSDLSVAALWSTNRHEHFDKQTFGCDEECHARYQC